MPTKYRVKRDHACFKAGDIVYSLSGPDYGLANEDSRYTGVEHKTVTFSSEGDYPGQTVPLHNIEKAED
jgi:hypothetical protein